MPPRRQEEKTDKAGKCRHCVWEDDERRRINSNVSAAGAAKRRAWRSCAWAAEKDEGAGEEPGGKAARRWRAGGAHGPRESGAKTQARERTRRYLSDNVLNWTRRYLSRNSYLKKRLFHHLLTLMFLHSVTINGDWIFQVWNDAKIP